MPWLIDNFELEDVGRKLNKLPCDRVPNFWQTYLLGFFLGFFLGASLAGYLCWKALKPVYGDRPPTRWEQELNRPYHIIFRYKPNRTACD